MIDAKVVRQLQAMVGCPTNDDLRMVIASGLLHNFPVTQKDLNVAEAIYGVSVPSLKGKTTRVAPDRVRTEILAVPHDILLSNQDVTIGYDRMFINKLPFLFTISENLKFTTIENIPNIKVQHILEALTHVQSVYRARGFNVVKGNADNEFAPLIDQCRDIGIQLNITAKDKHVPMIEHRIRVIKERFREVRHTLPYKSIPNLMIV